MSDMAMYQQFDLSRKIRENRRSHICEDQRSGANKNSRVGWTWPLAIDPVLVYCVPIYHSPRHNCCLGILLQTRWKGHSPIIGCMGRFRAADVFSNRCAAGPTGMAAESCSIGDGFASS